MLPYLQPGDQLIVEKVSLNMEKLGLKKDAIKRGDVIVFYPPFERLNPGIMNKFARLTGFSGEINLKFKNGFEFKPFFFMPRIEDAYIKRVIGLPGETIEIKKGDGVYIDGEKLLEAYPPSEEDDFSFNEYPLEKPRYSISSLSDIEELDLKYISDSIPPDSPIKVPAEHYFCLGDNRNNSKDSHVWGFLPKERVIGKAYSVIWRDLRTFRPRTISKEQDVYLKRLESIRESNSR